MDDTNQSAQPREPEKKERTGLLRILILPLVWLFNLARRSKLHAIIVGLLSIGGFKLFYAVVITSAIIEISHRTGHGWDDASIEFERSYRDDVKQDLADLMLDDITLSKIAGCQAREQLKILNSSNCYYKYNIYITSEDRHTQKLTACLEQLDLNSKADEARVKCYKEKIPNDWSTYKASFSKQFFEAKQFNTSDEKLQALGKSYAKCMADAHVIFLKNLNCKPLNTEANDYAGFFNSATCLDKHRDEIAKQVMSSDKVCSKILR